MSEEIKTNTIRIASADLTSKESVSKPEVPQKDEGEGASAENDSVQMRAARKIMREYADTLRRLADS